MTWEKSKSDFAHQTPAVMLLLGGLAVTTVAFLLYGIYGPVSSSLARASLVSIGIAAFVGTFALAFDIFTPRINDDV